MGTTSEFGQIMEVKSSQVKGKQCRSPFNTAVMSFVRSAGGYWTLDVYSQSGFALRTQHGVYSDVLLSANLGGFAVAV